jgi:pimeloyl-ACP methyl ester carboxylesterase
MQNPRKYGKPPFRVAVVHGGPGAAGEMEPVAQELSIRVGVLEPLQTASSVQGQIAEFKIILEKFSNPPVILIGFSWGAWLSFMLAAEHPGLVKKLILVGSGPFEEKYASEILPNRLSRLDGNDCNEAMRIFKILDEDNDAEQRDNALARMGELLGKIDAFDPIYDESATNGSNRSPPLKCDAEIFRRVWTEAAAMRQNGQLLALGKKINCPVVAIHGSWDPHPAAGVKEPLQNILSDFRFILLDECGHKPWIERKARHRYYSILKDEM